MRGASCTGDLICLSLHQSLKRVKLSLCLFHSLFSNFRRSRMNPELNLPRCIFFPLLFSKETWEALAQHPGTPASTSSRPSLPANIPVVIVFLGYARSGFASNWQLEVISQVIFSSPARQPPPHSSPPPLLQETPSPAPPCSSLRRVAGVWRQQFAREDSSDKRAAPGKEVASSHRPSPPHPHLESAAALPLRYQEEGVTVSAALPLWIRTRSSGAPRTGWNIRSVWLIKHGSQCGESARAALLLIQSLPGLVRKCAAVLVLKAELLLQDTSTQLDFERICTFRECGR